MKKSFLTPLALTGLMLLPALSQAATPEPGTITLTPQIGGYMFEGNQDLDDSVIFGLAPGYFFTRELAAEVVLQYVDTETDFSANNEDIDGWLYHVDVLYHFLPDNKLVPFVAAGLGGITLDDMPGESNTSLQMNYGAGLKYELTDNLDLRGDVRHMVSFDDHYNNLAALVGLTYSFGTSSAQPQQKVQPEPAPVVETKPEPVVIPPPPAVAQDSDGDGVNDELDQCPDSPADVAVDEQGCAITEEISVNLHVKFDHDKTEVKSTYDSHFQEVADFLQGSPNATAVIEGHTDNTGGPEYNLHLSQLRAEAVRQYFIDQFNIGAERLEAKGFGEENPIADNNTAAGQQDNRRVVATIKTTRHKTK